MSLAKQTSGVERADLGERVVNVVAVVAGHRRLGHEADLVDAGGGACRVQLALLQRIVRLGQRAQQRHLHAAAMQRVDARGRRRRAAQLQQRAGGAGMAARDARDARPRR